MTFEKMVENHQGEVFLLLKEEEENSYHSVTIEVGYYSPQKNEIFGDLENWGFTSADIKSGDVIPGVYVVESYGTSGARNDYICELFADWNTQAEEETNWARALKYEAQTSWFEAPHMKESLREQGWGDNDICRYHQKCEQCGSQFEW